MATIEGMDRIQMNFSKRFIKARDDFRIRVVVGYEAPYAVFVHEDLQANHPRGGQAKFLEQPARQYRTLIVDMMLKAVEKGLPFRSALALGGNRLLQLSRPLVPVDTGYLRDSGFVRVEDRPEGEEQP